MKYHEGNLRPGDIVLVEYGADVRAFEKIIDFREVMDEDDEVCKEIFTELLYDFYYRDEVVSEIEDYNGKEVSLRGHPIEDGTILNKWTKNDMEVFLMLET